MTTLAMSGQPALYYGYDGTGTTSGGNTTIISTNGNLGADCHGVDTHSTCLQYDAQGRPSYLFPANGMAIQLYYNAAGQRARYAVSQNAYSQSDQEFTYRGDELAQDVVTAYHWNPTSTTVYTDTYLYLPNGAPYDPLR